MKGRWLKPPRASLEGNGKYEFTATERYLSKALAAGFRKLPFETDAVKKRDGQF
ncbi:hypothetical protein [Trinickia terrae]|uniref:hypothetical protein n=1 Tax=Trinickia terrae TaxID=2571161 RepID=UPI00146DFE43|nr:hypothetical protein [Trinickia terrae]